MAKLSTIVLGGDKPCFQILKGKDRKLYECVVKCLEERSGQVVLQGRVILVFEPKGSRRKKQAAVKR